MNSDPVSLTIGDFAKKHVKTASTSMTLDEVIQIMVDFEIRHIPVVDGSTVKGIVSILDIMKYMLKYSDVSTLKDKVSNFYSKDILKVDLKDDMVSVLNKLSKIEGDCVIIMNGDIIEGIYTELDILTTDFLWLNISDESIHKKKVFGEPITDFNCISEDSSIVEGIELLVRLNRFYIGVFEPGSLLLKGVITCSGILKYILNSIDKTSNKLENFRDVPIFNMFLDPLFYILEPSTISTLRKEMYLNNQYVATLIDDDGYPFRLISIHHLIEYLMSKLGFSK